MIFKQIKKKKNKNLQSKLLPTTNYKLSTNKGFVILFATLLSSLFLIIGAFIFSISLKQLILSSGGRESQYAFYATNSGLECALYWDLTGEVFATSTFSGGSPVGSGIFCSEQDVTLSSDWDWNLIDATSAETTFRLETFSDVSDRNDCAVVTVYKNSGATVIESRGYNTCDETNPRRVERGLRISY